MRIDVQTGLLEGVEYLPSPHKSPRSLPIDLLVVHNISLPPNEYGERYIHDLFMGTLDCTRHAYFERLEGLQVSAHILINREGHITQFVPFSEQAWHAGISLYQGREACNGYSVGIELEGSDEEPFQEPQYYALAKLSNALISSYPKMSRDRIVGHSDIAPMRKTDPGPYFDWGYYRCIMDKVSA